jgi:hypothetical protein
MNEIKELLHAAPMILLYMVVMLLTCLLSIAICGGVLWVILHIFHLFT